MKGFQESHDVSEYLESSSSRLLNGGQQSTLWAIQQKPPIAAITIHEMEETLMLKVDISDIDLVKLDLQITPETILIQGKPTAATLVEDFFRPSGLKVSSSCPIQYNQKPVGLRPARWCKN
ncbi:hypothetical protein [Microcoleus sp. bin38.metabat.b11b12b14.051]|uniref:hypothetical protein n=1 Tax=Microcoleus sp. bin38.metabat.b11b12b14.051 TaxID=2742709 RepID=UPI0025D4CB5D|nr:hypothetical protein [Microcoleus sp. bin38.metabat.b11b12b14.051]